VVEPDLPTALARPRLRGVFHLWAFVVFAALGAVLIATAPGARERIAGAVFGIALVLAFGVSALYHRVTWRPAARRVMRRLDHASIYLLIAGTYTPYGLLVLSGAWQFSVLGVVWIGAALAIAQRLIWVDAPKWLAALAGISLGWVGVVAFPQIVSETGSAGTALVVAGGLLYTLGAVVYVVQRPDPVPSVFGYHEVFHLMTIAAAACQFAAIAFFVLPRA
jgi:hemolysin III